MKKILQAEWFPLAVLSFVLVAIGVAILPAYGLSWDEPRLYEYSQQSVSAYADALQGKTPSFGEDDLRFYGTAYLLFANRLTAFLHWVDPALPEVDGWHLVNFAVFVAGIWPLSYLSRRGLKRAASRCACSPTTRRRSSSRWRRPGTVRSTSRAGCR